MGRINSARLRTMIAPGFYGDGGGLYLQVRGPDKRSWIFRYRRLGRAHLMGLGPYPDVGLAEARDAADEARKLLRAGKDPLTEKQARKRAEAPMLFREVAERYLTAHEKSWRNPKHRQQWRNTLNTYAMPTLGRLPVASIGVGEIMKVIEPLWHEKTETASRVRGRIECIMDYARARGWRDGDNPARWRGHLQTMLPTRNKIAPVENHPALSLKEIGSFMAALRQENNMGARALEFAILMAARSGEVRGARWAEIDLAQRIWMVPKERMKATREHRVPLSDAAVAVLREMLLLRDEHHGDLVFPGQRRGGLMSDQTLSAVLRRMKRAETVHGFRAAFRTWCGETGKPPDIAEAALAHTQGKLHETYQRGDLLERRRKLMDQWAEFCSRSLPAEGGNVVELHGAVA